VQSDVFDGRWTVGAATALCSDSSDVLAHQNACVSQGPGLGIDNQQKLLHERERMQALRSLVFRKIPYASRVRFPAITHGLGLPPLFGSIAESCRAS